MLNEYIKSISDNLNNKTRNPFLGTYTIVWMVRNWELLFMLFNFDKDYNMEKKIMTIKAYFNNHDFSVNLLLNILISFVLLTLTYLLLNISRYIVNTFEKRVTPWVYKKTDISSIVTKKEYIILHNRYIKLESDIDIEREKRYKEEKRAKDLENELLDLKNTKRTDTTGIIQNQNKETDKAKNVLKLIGSKNYSAFKEAFIYIKKGNRLNNKGTNKIHDFLISHNLIELVNNNNISSQYKLTNIGNEVFELINKTYTVS